MLASSLSSSSQCLSGKPLNRRHRPVTRTVRPRAITAVLKIPESFSKLQPKGEYVLVQAAAEETKTLGGVLLPSSAAQKPTTGTVTELGDGKKGSKTKKFTLKKGDTVLYSKFGFMFTELKMKDQDYLVIREDDVIGVLPKPDATADDCSDLKPIGDRVLIKIEETGDVSAGGVVLPDSAKERPMSGKVIRVGDGKEDDDGKMIPLKLKAGDRVLYFKYAGENMETTKGDKYVVLHESDVLCKA